MTPEAGSGPPVGRPDRTALALVAILALAALVRLVGLEGRGTWDADQATDMLVLWRWTHDGTWPLLGPLTSIGTFHHGALYYWLLSPAAFVVGPEPLPVTGLIAISGIAAVGLTWWLGRMVGGPLAGHVAGLLAAVSPSAIEQSTFIWNPNLIPLTASLALAAAWRAWSTRRARWWVLSGLGVMGTMQLHVLGIVLLPPVAGLLLADAWRARATPSARRGLVGAGIAALLVIAAGYLPLIAHELSSELAETRAIAAYLGEAGGGGAAAADRVLVVAGRVLAWPIVGLLSANVPASLAALGVIVVALAWRLLAARGPELTAVRWLAVIVAWSIVSLAVTAPSLGTIVEGLPNDHYHAFVDPAVFVVVAVAVARAARTRIPGATVAGPVVAAAALAGLLVAEVAAWPAMTAPDGGWPLAASAADRARLAAGNRPVALVEVPAMKPPTALAYPLVRAGVDAVLVGSPRGGPASVPDGVGAVIVACDPLFELVVARPCGGAAEDGRLAAVVPDPAAWRLADRYEAGPRRVVSVYERAP